MFKKMKFEIRNTKQHQEAFRSFKYDLSNIKSVAYYDIKKETYLFVDLGPKGLEDPRGAQYKRIANAIG